MVGVDRAPGLVGARQCVVDAGGVGTLNLASGDAALDPITGQVIRARCGSARVWAWRRLHMPIQFLRVVAAAMPRAERFAFTGTPA